MEKGGGFFLSNFGNVLSPDQLGSIVLLFQTFDEIRDVFVQNLPVFLKIHLVDSGRGISFELPEIPFKKILVQSASDGPDPVRFVFACPV